VADAYRLKIKDGDPPDQGKTSYDTKVPSGTLFEIAKRIRPGQYVENLSAGSLGKLRGLIEERGLTVISRRRIGETRATLYVVTEKWLERHPDRT
jgi:hypothetical protein